MDKITCDFINCYGIRRLQHEFDFSNTNDGHERTDIYYDDIEHILDSL